MKKQLNKKDKLTEILTLCMVGATLLIIFMKVLFL